MFVLAESFSILKLFKKPADIVAQAGTILVDKSIDVLADQTVGALPVVDDDNIKDIVSGRGFVRVISQDNEALDCRRVEDVMTKSIITCGIDDMVEDVFKMMYKKGIRHIPVMEENRLVALLSARDFQRVYVEAGTTL